MANVVILATAIHVKNLMKKLTPRQSQIVQLRTEEHLSPNQIAERLSCDASYVYRMLRDERVQEELVQAARSALSSLLPTAVGTVGRLASSAKSEYVQLQAALAVLDRAGLAEPSAANTLAIQINLD